MPSHRKSRKRHRMASGRLSFPVACSPIVMTSETFHPLSPSFQPPSRREVMARRTRRDLRRGDFLLSPVITPCRVVVNGRDVGVGPRMTFRVPSTNSSPTPENTTKSILKTRYGMIMRVEKRSLLFSALMSKFFHLSIHCIYIVFNTYTGWDST